MVFDDQGDALDSREVTDKINRHWRQVWMEQRQAESPTPEAIAATLVQDFGRPVVTTWSEWSEQDLRTALAKASGSAGTDSWSAAEVRCLPPEAVHTWFLLTQQWLRCGTLPLQLRQVRMVNLVKAHKVRANRRLSVGDCRPISVMSVFWRIFASAWSRKARAWMDSNLPTEIGSRAGAAGAEDLASELQDALVCNGGFLASLDYAQCYDRMQGDAATAALEQLGWPGELCRLMRQAWVHDRFVSWDQHTSSDVLKASAVPQGCPLAPVTLLIWMTSGVRWTEAQLTHTGASLTRVYMDDRSWWASRWSGVEERINSWTSWSRRVGLKESTSKTQITAKGRTSRTLLALNADPAWIREDAKILGCTTVTSGRRRDSETETDRLARAARRASLLRCTGLPWFQMQKAFQYFVGSIAGFGWIGKLPTRRVTDGLFQAFSRATDHQHRASSPLLRRVLFGGALHLDVKVASGLFARLCRRRHRGIVTRWHDRAASSVGLLRRWLKEQGWRESRPWVWRHGNAHSSAEERVLSLEAPCSEQVLSRQLHALRYQWRAQHFLDWALGARHEARDLVSRRGLRRLLRDFQAIDLEKTRQALQLGGACRAVLLGAVVSDAWLSVSQQLPDRCSLCGHSPGSWEHLAWHCRCPGLGPRPECPENLLVARFGWIRKGPRAASDRRVLAHLANCLSALWAARHES